MKIGQKQDQKQDQVLILKPELMEELIQYLNTENI